MLSRREFVQLSLAAVAGWPQAADPFAGGTLIGTRPLSGRGAPASPFGTLVGTGLDARMITDLSILSPDRLITPNDQFYIRTSYPDTLDPSRPWTVTLGGLVRQPVTVTLHDLARDVGSMGTHLLECAGNSNPGDFGLMSAARWSGVPVARILDGATPSAASTRVLISGYDAHSKPSRTSVAGASWIFRRDELERSGAFLATGMNGDPLPRDHGFPLRLVVPRWYGCACIKWVNAIELVPDDAAATSQMQEFAARTFQDGRPERARDYAPPVMDHAAMPVRVEKWIVGGRLLYRVIGIIWGGDRATDALAIRFKSGEPYVPVSSCPTPANTTMWSLWWHAWRPPSRGRYDIVLKIDDPNIRSRRLDVYFYARSVDIDEV